MTVRNLSNVYNVPSVREANLGTSNTVPDMSPSLRDMLDKHSRGGAVEGFSGAYIRDDHPLIPVGMENMDVFERRALSRQIGDMIEVERGKLVSAERAKRDAEFKRAVDAAAAAQLAQRESSKSEQAEGNA